MDNWQALYVHTDARGRAIHSTSYQPKIPNGISRTNAEGEEEGYALLATWMECPNAECALPIIGITGYYETDDPEAEEGNEIDSWIAFPRFGETVVPPEVPEEFAADRREASAIADISPRMASVLVRNILTDLLEAQGYKGSRLTSQVGAFLADKNVPSRIRVVADPLRALGDFGAHSLRDESGQRIEVAPDDAKWMLIIIDRLFDHFYVEPERDRVATEAVNQMVARAKRAPLRKPPP